ncbi:ankyrin repeat domain-containing protein [Luteibacter sp. 9135]|uniref:ankyrin repeat domain-containing protein n=1 Tax=Luteibacter sp. 9135 TaxID=1500893 RepID=UPI003F8C5812
MNRSCEARLAFALLIAAAASAAHASTPDCLSMQQAAAQDAISQASHGDSAARLRSAVLSRDDAAFDSALGELVGRTDETSTDALKQALAGAAWIGNSHALSALLSARVDPDATSPLTASPPIVLAAQCGQTEAMAALLTKGANIAAGSTPDHVDNVPRGALEAALVGGQPKTATWLLDHGYDVCQTGERARIGRLLSHPGLSAAWPASLKARLICQAPSAK